jgi:hypothetical protein
MKARLLFASFLLIIVAVIYSCSKQELFKSEKEVKEELQGTWELIPIPRNDTTHLTDSTYTVAIHVENWTFDDTKVTIVNNNQTATSTYSVSTSISKAEFDLDAVIPEFTYPARVRDINGTWRIVTLDDELLIIANDQSGTTGLTELEFKKR